MWTYLDHIKINIQQLKVKQWIIASLWFPRGWKMILACRCLNFVSLTVAFHNMRRPGGIGDIQSGRPVARKLCITSASQQVGTNVGDHIRG